MNRHIQLQIICQDLPDPIKNLGFLQFDDNLSLQDLSEQLKNILQNWAMQQWEIQMTPPFTFKLEGQKPTKQQCTSNILSFLKEEIPKTTIMCELEIPSPRLSCEDILRIIQERTITTITQLSLEEQQALKQLMTYPQNIQNLIKATSVASYYLPKKLCRDPKIIKLSIQHGGSLFHASPDLLENRDFIIEILKIDGIQLQHVPEKLKNDPECIETALLQNPLAFAYVGDLLRKDTRFIAKIADRVVITEAQIIATPGQGHRITERSISHP